MVFCIDRAGFAGADGPTHHGLYDVPYLRAIPNVIISSPRNEQELRDMMYSASTYEEAAWAIRYPRGEATGMDMRKDFKQIEVGKAEILKEGDDIAILTFGPIAEYAEEAIQRASLEGLEIGHVDMRFAKPLDRAMLDELALQYKAVITLEDGTVEGGFGSAVAEYYADKPLRPSVHIMGIPDRIVEHGTQRELHDEVGIGPDGIFRMTHLISEKLNQEIA